LTQADLEGAKLRRASLWGTKLVSAQLGLKIIPIAAVRAENPEAFKLTPAERLTERLKAGADLYGADLQGSDLTDAWLVDANLDLTIYEASKDPQITGIARAQHLDLVTYASDPEALVRLRKAFGDGGFVQAENKITYALNRRETADAPFQWRWFRRIAFDWTCQYGMNPGRPLKILGLVWLVMSGLYLLFMHLKGPSGIYVEATRESCGRERNWRFQVQLPHTCENAESRAKGATRKPGRWLRGEWRLARAAMFFSLISAFNIGYQELNIGQWLKMLTRREYDLKAGGWVRTAAGTQSLVSVYMLALWVLTYFGHPFE
jgi:Pentapeptide repeats (8 copies)